MRIKFWLLSILLVLSLMPIGHTVVMLLREINDVNLWIVAHLTIGFMGIFVIHQGSKYSETTASILGFLGAHFIFMGVFELLLLFCTHLNIQ